MGNHMMDEETHSPDIRERIGTLAAKASAAHERIDRLEVGLREDLKEIKKDLTEVLAWMNRGKGWGAAALLIAGLMGGIAAQVVKSLIK